MVAILIIHGKMPCWLRRGVLVQRIPAQALEHLCICWSASGTSSEFFNIRFFFTEQNPEAMFLSIKYLLQLAHRHTFPYRYPVSHVALKESVVDYFM